MNAISTTMPGPLALFAERLNGVAGPQRHAALGALARTGLPTRHTEAWKYTALRALGTASFAAPPAGYDMARAQALLDSLLAGHESLAMLARVVLVNGVHAPELSRAPDTLEVGFFSQSPTFGLQAAPDRDPLVALNTALAQDGVTLSVPAGVQAGQLAVISLGLGGEQALSCHPRHAISLGAGASLSVLSVHAGEGA